MSMSTDERKEYDLVIAKIRSYAGDVEDRLADETGNFAHDFIRYRRDSENLDKLRIKMRELENEISRGYGSRIDADRFVAIVDYYRSTGLDGLKTAKSTTEDCIVWMRSMALVLHMVGNASTHGEKNARLRGCIELVESAIERLRNIQFDFSFARWHEPDLFRSDYPVKAAMDKLHQAHDEIKGLQSELEQLKSGKPTAVDEQPF